MIKARIFVGGIPVDALNEVHKLNGATTYHLETALKLCVKVMETNVRGIMRGRPFKTTPQEFFLYLTTPRHICCNAFFTGGVELSMIIFQDVFRCTTRIAKKVGSCRKQN